MFELDVEFEEEDFFDFVDSTDNSLMFYKPQKAIFEQNRFLANSNSNGDEYLYDSNQSGRNTDPDLNNQLNPYRHSSSSKNSRNVYSKFLNQSELAESFHLEPQHHHTQFSNTSVLHTQSPYFQSNTAHTIRDERLSVNNSNQQQSLKSINEIRNNLNLLFKTIV
jgi:hypothetical protein